MFSFNKHIDVVIIGRNICKILRMEEFWSMTNNNMLFVNKVIFGAELSSLAAW